MATGTTRTTQGLMPTAEDMMIAQLYALNLPRPEGAAGLSQCLYPPPELAQMLGLGPAPPGAVIGPGVPLPAQFGGHGVALDPLMEAQQQQAQAALMVASGGSK